MTDVTSHETCKLEDVAAHIEDTTPGDVSTCTYHAPEGLLPETLVDVCTAKAIRDGNVVCLKGICVKAVADWIKQGGEPIYPLRSSPVQPIDRTI